MVQRLSSEHEVGLSGNPDYLAGILRNYKVLCLLILDLWVLENLFFFLLKNTQMHM